MLRDKKEIIAELVAKGIDHSNRWGEKRLQDALDAHPMEDATADVDFSKLPGQIEITAGEAPEPIVTVKAADIASADLVPGNVVQVVTPPIQENEPDAEYENLGADLPHSDVLPLGEEKLAETIVIYPPVPNKKESWEALPSINDMSFTVYNYGRKIRNYSQEIHGENYMELAKQFVQKQKK